MDETASGPRASRDPVVRRFPALLAGATGCLFLMVTTSPRSTSNVDPTLIGIPLVGHEPQDALGWVILATPVAAAILALCLLRWWPYLLVAAGLLTVPQVLSELPVADPLPLYIVNQAAYPLAIVGVLAGAQGLFRRGAAGWAAVVTGLTVGSRLFGTDIVGITWLPWQSALPGWHVAMVAVGFAGLIPAVWWHRRGDPAAAGPVAEGRWSWRRHRVVVAAGLASCLVIPLSFLTTERLAEVLGVTWSALYRHRYAEAAVIGAITLVGATALAAVAGRWSLAGALTAATVQVAVVAPTLLAAFALMFQNPDRLWGGLAGVVLGAVAARNRWRIALAGALTVVAATALFIAYGATTGHPEKLADQHRVVPAMLILVLITAAATAVVGATAPVLAPRGALPAIIGPLTGVLVGGGVQTVDVTYLHNGLPVSSYLNPVYHLTTSAILLLAAGAAIGGLGFAQQLSARRAERLQAEQIRLEAAAAERDRLARPIHDGVLQVLALVQRHGSELGGTGSQLAALAGEQEVALRGLLSGAVAAARDSNEDVRSSLLALASPAIEVAAPARPVVLPAHAATELTAAVRAALDNVRRHAGPGARAWVLLEAEPDGVRVTVRDDGVGFAPGRLDEAADSGRLGVAQSMRGRIADCGGTTTIHSRPGDGTEVEFWLPHP